MPLSLLKAYSGDIEEHRTWLSSYGQQRLKRWEDLLISQPEPAICEAVARKFFLQHVDKIEAFEDLSTGGPDFRCGNNDRYFYVEATCITKEVITNKTTLEPSPANKASNFRVLTETIFGEICNKTPQCSGLDGPCLIAVCTLHFSGGQLCFQKRFAEELLSGKPYIACPIDMQAGDATGEPYERTNLQSAAFIRPTKNSEGLIEYARNPISGILLCPFGCMDPDVIGVLHPNPNHVFDISLLPGTEFCRLKDGYQTGHIEFEWI